MCCGGQLFIILGKNLQGFELLRELVLQGADGCCRPCPPVCLCLSHSLLASAGHLVLSMALGHLTSARGSGEGLLSGRLAFLRQLTDVPSL